MERFDKIEFKARKTEEGYLMDTPIVARSGIQSYRTKNGKIRREYRPPEVVSEKAYLDSFSGKPITFYHPKEMVNSKNVKNVLIGSAHGNGFTEPFGNLVAVRVPVIVYDEASVQKVFSGSGIELSVGYTIELDETPGEVDGEKYDAIQRSLRVNHISIVPRGRAGIARFNLDSLDNEDAVLIEGDKMKEQSKIRLDNGLEYLADPEVIQELEKMRKDSANCLKELDELKGRFDSLQAERDTYKTKADSLEKVRKDAFEEAKKVIRERMSLENSVQEFKLDKIEDLSDREIKVSVLKELRKDFDLSEKSDEYVNAMFDLAMKDHKDKNIQSQRKDASRKDSAPKVKNSYDDFMEKLKNKGE